MARNLTGAERKRVNDALQRKLDYKKLRTPEEWHQFALHWNWDDGFAPLQWIIEQPLCDRGTALHIYWHASPTWFYQFDGREDVRAHNGNIDEYDFLKNIEARYLSGFYTRQEIKFDPFNADGDGDDLTATSAGVTLKQELPPELKQVTQGEIVLREELVEIVVRPLNEKEQRKVARHLNQGFRELLKSDPTLALDTAPTAVVDAIALAVEKYRMALSVTEAPKATDPILNLGWLWAEQLRRAYDWEWMSWDYGSGARVGIFSDNSQYASFPPNLINYTIAVKSCPNSIRKLFDQLSRVERTQDLAEAYSVGWVMLNRFFIPS